MTGTFGIVNKESIVFKNMQMEAKTLGYNEFESNKYSILRYYGYSKEESKGYISNFTKLIEKFDKTEALAYAFSELSKIKGDEKEEYIRKYCMRLKNGFDEVQADISTRLDLEMKDEEYINEYVKEYTNMVLLDYNREESAIYAKCICDGKNRKEAEIYADAYCHVIRLGKDALYADTYANLILEGFDCKYSYNYASEYVDAKKKGLEDFKARKRANAVAMIKYEIKKEIPEIDYRTSLYKKKFAETFDKELSKMYLKYYDKAIAKGFKCELAKMYADLTMNLKNKELVRKYMDIYSGALDKGLESKYAIIYTKLAMNKFNPSYISKFLEIYERVETRHYNINKSFLCTRWIVEGNEFEYAGKYADVFIKKKEEGNKLTYSHAYACRYVMTNNEEEADRYATKYDEAMSGIESDGYYEQRDAYARCIALGYDEEYARTFANTYTTCREKLGLSIEHSNKEAKVITECLRLPPKKKQRLERSFNGN